MGIMRIGDHRKEDVFITVANQSMDNYWGDDYWVHLRNMQLLTDAQVDFLVIDATNALI